MLIIKCAGCKSKLFKYDKVGQGGVLRCYKEKIVKYYKLVCQNEIATCQCGNKIGVDLGHCFKMISSAFIYSGTKRN